MNTALAVAIRKRGQTIAKCIGQEADAILPTLQALAANRSLEPDTVQATTRGIFDGLKKSAAAIIVRKLVAPIEIDDTEIEKGADNIVLLRETQPAPSVVEIAKSLVEDGIGTTLSKRDFYTAMLKGAGELPLKSGETSEQRFSRYVTTTGDGRLLMQAYKVAKGDEPEKPQRADPPMTPSLQALWGIADKILEENPKLTKEQSFARAMQTKEGRRHYKSYKSEIVMEAHR